jgi:uncharacterized protein (DUF983 family)
MPLPGEGRPGKAPQASSRHPISIRPSLTSISMKDDALQTFARGALGRCPKCGQGRLFGRYLKVVECCSVCGEPYGHYRADDAPPWLTILLVGHITVPLILFVEETFEPPPWVEFAVYLPSVLLLTLLILPRCKGVILAILWRMKAEGSEIIPNEDRPLLFDRAKSSIAGVANASARRRT